ncbi:MAG: Ldh family oxidoreductase [Thermoleophilia bacterium]|nr:Ldh family oxidoreductase [Thermoleophilia bacterium]
MGGKQTLHRPAEAARHVRRWPVRTAVEEVNAIPEPVGPPQRGEMLVHVAAADVAHPCVTSNPIQFGEQLHAEARLVDDLVVPAPVVGPVLRETPSTAAIDGGNGLGLVVGPKANEIAMKKAEAVGSGWVTVRNSNHFGIAGYYPLQALARDLIGFAFTNSIALVSPARGSGRVLGTNPIAVAFPGRDEPPVVIDLATSVVPFGKIEIAQRLAQPLGAAWATDRHGQPTREPTDVIGGGALTPLGGTEAGAAHKGYCLSAMVDLLSGVLAGANWGPFCPPFRIDQPIPTRSVGAGLGHCFGALQIAGFADPDGFKRSVDEWCRTMRAVQPADPAKPVLIPGDPERAAEAERRVHGIPLPPAVVADLQTLARLTGASPVV